MSSTAGLVGGGVVTVPHIVAVTLRTAALGYTGEGWPVFPCRPDSKVPATVHGFKDAATDPSVIAGWWSRTPDANVAIPTGTSTVDVLDVDVKGAADGRAALERLKHAGLLGGDRKSVV